MSGDMYMYSLMGGMGAPYRAPESSGPMPNYAPPAAYDSSQASTDEDEVAARIQALAAHPPQPSYATQPPGAGPSAQLPRPAFPMPEANASLTPEQAQLLARRDALIQKREVDPKTMELLNKRDELIQKREHDQLVALAAMTNPARGPEMLYQYLTHPLFRSK